MPQHQPLFSVIIPTYNRAALLSETLESMLKQTFKDFELIIVDDGSTDDTEATVSSRLQADSRIRYFKKQNGERGAARNFGVGMAKGTYVTFIDSDDVAHPFALETAYNQLLKNGNPACFALRYEVRDKETMLETLPPPDVKGSFANEALKKGNVLGCIGVFIQVDIAKSLPFEEDRRFAGTEDWLLWLKLGARYEIIYNDKICYRCYQHNSRSVMTSSEETLLYRAEQIRRYLLEDEPSLRAYGVVGINVIYAHMLTYASLHLAMGKKKVRALQYLGKGIRVNTQELFSRRTMGILKNILLR